MYTQVVFSNINVIQTSNRCPLCRRIFKKLTHGSRIFRITKPRVRRQIRRVVPPRRVVERRITFLPMIIVAPQPLYFLTPMGMLVVPYMWSGVGFGWNPSLLPS